MAEMRRAPGCSLLNSYFSVLDPCHLPLVTLYFSLRYFSLSFVFSIFPEGLRGT